MRYLICLFLLWSVRLSAQENIAVGAWRVHLTYHNALSVADGGASVFTASENGLFQYDKTEKTLSVISKINGLSDISFSRLAWHESSKTLLITYRNGNIDFYANNEIVNLRTILNSRFEDKKALNIAIKGNFAYIAYPFGIVVVDVVKREVRETYANLGERGISAPVYALALTQDSIFAATNNGLLASSLNASVNKQDFRNWQRLNIPLCQPAGCVIRNLTARNNQVFITLDGLGVFQYDNGRFSRLNIPSATYTGLDFSNNVVAACTPNEVYAVANNNTVTRLNNPKIVSPQQALADAKGNFWIADNATGLVTNATGAYENIFPSGVYSPKVLSLTKVENKIVATSGGFSNNYFPLNNLNGFYVFENGIWTNYNHTDKIIGSKPIPTVRDLCYAAYSAAEKKVYFSSFQDGLLVWDLKNQQFTLEAVTSGSINAADNRIVGVAVSQNNDIMVSNFMTRSTTFPIFKRKTTDKNWFVYTPDGNRAFFPLEVLYDDNQQAWVRFAPNMDSGGGVLVLNDKNQSRILTTIDGQGDLPSLNVYCLAKDKEGNVWVGTESGLRIFNPARIIGNNSIDDAIVVYDRRELFRSEKVNAIVFDGGNRKWIGTDNGAWLFGASNSEPDLIYHFTAENSPLLSNKILDIEILDQSGEVFFATDKGIVSFRSTATEGFEAFADVKVFPNPAVMAQTNLISISGLAANANVKITDVAGRLVFQTNAEGGTATWDGNDYGGGRAKTGIYLVHCLSPDGTQKFITKFAVIE